MTSILIIEKLSFGFVKITTVPPQGLGLNKGEKLLMKNEKKIDLKLLKKCCDL